MEAGCLAAHERCVGSDKVTLCNEAGELELVSCGAGELCYEAECGPVVCEPGAIESCLDDGRYHGCNAVGTGIGDFSCAVGQTCLEGGCVSRICFEGETRCGEDGDEVLVCNAAGTGFVASGRCSDSDLKRVCDEGECKAICDVAVKSASYVGCDYWAVDLDNAIDGSYDAAGQTFAVVVSNASSELAAKVAVYDKAGYFSVPQAPLVNLTLQPDELEVIVLPPGCYGETTCPEAYRVNATTVVEGAYRVVSDVPITAYQFNPLDNVEVFSNDASLLMPTTALGRRYRVMTRMQQHDTLRGYLTVVASEEGLTEVEVEVKGRTLEGEDKYGNAIPALNAGDKITFQLEQFDVLNLMTNEVGSDLTGSQVIADKNVVVFGGSEAANAPETDPITCCADHLEQQLYPVNTWGKRYHAVKSYPRKGERDLWRIMARLDDTQVETLPAGLAEARTLGAGEWFEITTTESFEIVASRPILVGQFLASEWDPIDLERGVPSQEAAGIGDPAFILGVPVEQYRRDYVFLVPNQYAADYITVVAPLGAAVTLDGELLDAEAFRSFGSEGYSYHRLEVADGVHHLTADQAVGLFVYGYDDYVSYGYPAGLDLVELLE